MGSSAEQEESRVDSQVARALEAVKDPFLRKIAERFQKEPNQILKLSNILGFKIEEEKNTKSLIWLKKHEPERYKTILNASRAENKTQEEKKMKVEWGRKHYNKEVARYEEKLFDKIGRLFEKLLADTDLVTVWNKGYNWGLSVIPSQSKEAVDNDYQNVNHVEVLNVHYDLAHLLPIGQAQPIFEGFRQTRGWAVLTVKVYDKAYLNLAKKFVRRYEKRSKCSASIVKEY